MKSQTPSTKLKTNLKFQYPMTKTGFENAIASAFPVACFGVSERTTIKWINSLHFEDSLQLAVGSFNVEKTILNKRNTSNNK